MQECSGGKQEKTFLGGKLEIKNPFTHMHGCLYDWFRTYLDQSRTHPMRYVPHVLRSTMRATGVSTELEAVLVSQEQLASRYVCATEGRKGAADKYH